MSAVLLLAAAIAVYPIGAAKGVSAKNLVERIIDLIKGTHEEGFRLVDEEGQRFLYARETPNYIAYTGKKADYGSHIVRLEKDGQAVEYTFVELRKTFVQPATPSAELEKEATFSADLTEDQKEKVEDWQQELEEI